MRKSLLSSSRNGVCSHPWSGGKLPVRETDKDQRLWYQTDRSCHLKRCLGPNVRHYAQAGGRHQQLVGVNYEKVQIHPLTNLCLPHSYNPSRRMGHCHRPAFGRCCLYHRAATPEIEGCRRCPAEIQLLVYEPKNLSRNREKKNLKPFARPWMNELLLKWNLSEEAVPMSMSPFTVWQIMIARNAAMTGTTLSTR